MRHCGNLITGEVATKAGKQYIYYRCTMYNAPGHPRDRLTESQIDEQVLDLFRRIPQPGTVREWLPWTLREWSKTEQENSREQTDDLQRELARLPKQQDALLNLRLLDEIDASTFASKNTELRDRIANATLQLEATDHGRDEQAGLAIKLFELSQGLAEQWLESDYAEKRQLLQIVVLNFSLDGVTLVPTMRSPFDLLVEGRLVSSNRGDKI